MEQIAPYGVRRRSYMYSISDCAMFQMCLINCYYICAACVPHSIESHPFQMRSYRLLPLQILIVQSKTFANRMSLQESGPLPLSSPRYLIKPLHT